MHGRRADARFLLPDPVHTATVIGDLSDWECGLRAVGVELIPATTGRTPDCVVAPAALAARAAATGASNLLLAGRVGSRALAAAGYHVRHVVSIPGRDGPRLLVPFDAPAVFRARFAPAAWLPWKAEAATASTALRLGAVPSRYALTLATIRPAQPYLLDLAAPFVDTAASQWMLQLGDGRGDVLQRGVMPVVPAHGDAPTVVVKFGRVPEAAAAFGRDDAALRAVARAGPVAADHAPRLLAREVVHGLPVSVETAAAGRPLGDLLRARLPRRRQLALIDRIAAWIVDVAEGTRGPRSPVDGVAGALQHNDLGTWNVITDGDAFTVVDWESSTDAGLPLGDLLYFLADAFLQLDGPRDPGQHVAWLIRLFRGDTNASPALFAWVDRAARRLGLDDDTVGPIAAACWLHHARSPEQRQHVLAGRHAMGGTPERQAFAPLALIGDRWLADPALGRSWTARRR